MRVTTSMLRYSNNTRDILSSVSSRRNSSKKVSGFNKSNLRCSSLLEAGKASTVYKQTKKAAAGLREHTENLFGSGKNSLISKAVESGDTGGAVKEIEGFVEDYNAMVSGMKKTGGSINNIYLNQLSSYAKSSEEELKAIGVSQKKDGSLSVDKEKLAAADASKLQEVFGGVSGFGGQTAVKSIYVEANAAESISSQQNAMYTGYNSYGSYSGYNSNSSFQNILGNYFNSLY